MSSPIQQANGLGLAINSHLPSWPPVSAMRTFHLGLSGSGGGCHCAHGSATGVFTWVMGWSVYLMWLKMPKTIQIHPDHHK